MPELDRKAASVFAGKVVRKDLVRKVKVGANVPVFVLEYLLGKYCATDDPAAIEAGMKVVNSTLSSNFVRPDEANKAQSLVKDKGKHTLIDKVKVRYLADDDKHWAELVNFGHKYVHIPEHYLRQFDRLLMEGIWAQVDLRHQYDEEAKGKKSPFWIDSVKPIQVATFDLGEYCQCRAQFSTDEWIDLLIRSIGMEPSHFDRRLKLILLTRLIPLCEHNFNLVELGPRGTGKSYAYQELSPYTILLTGPTTVANLFYNMATGKMGVAQQVDTTDFHVEAIDLLSNHVACEAGIALVVAVYSAIKKTSVLAGLVILGDLSIQGNIKSLRSLSEPLQVAMDNGARRALIPLENKRNFLEVSGDIVERVDPIFFSDPMTAAMKALGMT